MEYTQNFTSDFFTIVINSVQMFFMNLGTIFDRIMILFGSERAQEVLDAKIYNIKLVADHSADLQTATHIITTIILWLMLIALIIWVIYLFLPKKIVKNLFVNPIAQLQTGPIKTEIINDGKYINLDKGSRIKYLYALKEQTVTELTSKRKELELEHNRLNDIPTDIAKYVKPNDISALKASISKLENKITAIDELIESETTPQKQKTFDLDDDD